jgi:hypothetical protein
MWKAFEAASLPKFSHTILPFPSQGKPRLSGERVAVGARPGLCRRGEKFYSSATLEQYRER